MPREAKNGRCHRTGLLRLLHPCLIQLAWACLYCQKKRETPVNNSASLTAQVWSLSFKTLINHVEQSGERSKGWKSRGNWGLFVSFSLGGFATFMNVCNEVLKTETLTFVAQLTYVFTAGIHYIHVAGDFFFNWKIHDLTQLFLCSFILPYCSKSWAVFSWNVKWRALRILNLPDLIRTLLLFAIKNKLYKTQCQCFEWILHTQCLCLLMLAVMR